MLLCISAVGYPNEYERYAFSWADHHASFRRRKHDRRAAMSIRISLVTLSFNQARFLEKAIRSVIDQDHPDVEYIVVDPGSTDGSRSIIERYRDCIDHLVYEPDDGPADGLNHGFAHATGDVFGFINADDWLEPDALDTIARMFGKYPDVDVIAAHGWLVDEQGRRIRRKYSNPFTAWRYLHQGAYLLQQSTFFRASAFRKIGGFNPNNRSCWDGELWLDLALAGCRFKIVDDLWSSFRVYQKSITGSVSQGGVHRKLYRNDRNRMYREATGRQPAGALFRAKQLLAWVIKALSNPNATFHRIISMSDARSRRSPI